MSKTLTQVPELSLKSYMFGTPKEKDKFSAELFEGLKHFGFIILKDHSIDDKFLEQAYELNKKLFDLPLKTKESYIVKDALGRTGYTPFGREKAKDAEVSDLKEFWHTPLRTQLCRPSL